MGEKRSPQTAIEALQALNQFLEGPEPDFGSMAIDDVRASLEKAGVNPDDLIKQIRELMGETEGRLALAQAREKREVIDQRLKVRTAPRDPPRTFEALLEQIARIFGEEQAAAYARKYERRDDEDLRSLVDDLEALKGLDGVDEG